MTNPEVYVSRLTSSERLELLEALWNSLDPAEAPPISPDLAAELERRSDEAARDPDGGRDWDQVKADLKNRLP